ncbi:MAG: methionyl-tRNA formyltransferase [bacterium]|nr:methionyl-tRNA formyltransferase [bacterium]
MKENVLNITFLVDDRDSWIVPYAEKTAAELRRDGHECRVVFSAPQIPEGDMLFLLGCTKKVGKEFLLRNRNNLVIHESDLPRGKGWSPLSWQVLAGCDRIPVCVFEAVEELDAGPVYERDFISLDGTELLPELKRKQGEKTVELVKRMVERYPELHGEVRQGESSFYDRRTAKDDRLDIDKTIRENFDHLRIVDNEKYPAWFQYRGKKYILKIYAEEL